MTNCVASNNYKPEYKFTNTDLRNIIKKERIIKNLNVSKTEISRANKTTLINIINKYNINTNKYHNDIAIAKSFYIFMGEVGFYNYGNNIHKPYKYRKLSFKLNNIVNEYLYDYCDMCWGLDYSNVYDIHNINNNSVYNKFLKYNTY